MSAAAPRKQQDLDDLDELLRRCHREELMPLARRLRVEPGEAGLKDFAVRLARAVRGYGSHFVTNAVFRKGDGPPYRQVLEEVAARCGVTPFEDLEQTEIALLAWWIESRWKRLNDAWRARMWQEMGLDPPVPADGTTAVVRAQQGLGRRFGYLAVPLYALVLGTPLGAGCLALFMMVTRPSRRQVLEVLLEVARIRQVVRHRVTVGIVGSPSSGKDAAMGAIFGVHTGNVDPVAGSTREVSITRLEGSTALYLVNTPGMGDIVEQVTEEARQVLHHIDVFVYLVNSQGGVQARELSDYRRCVATGRPVLAVVNKIDTLRDSDRERYLDDARAKLDAQADDFLAAAFDPLPQLSEGPIGLDAVRDWLAEHLVELGKDPSELPWVAEEAT